jgi:predicted metal-binding protein
MAATLSAVIVLAWLGGAAASLIISIEPPVTVAAVGDTVEIAVYADGPDSVGWYWTSILTSEEVLTYLDCSTDILQGCPNGWNCMRCGPTGEPGVFEADCACFGQHTCVEVPGNLILIRYISIADGTSPVSFQFIYVSDCDRNRIPLDAVLDGVVVVGDASVEPGNGYPDYSVSSFTGFPNPFRHDIKLQLRVEAHTGSHGGVGTPCEIRIFDCMGREVKEFRVTLSPGEYVLHWDGSDRRGRDVPAGIYFCRYPVEGGFATYKITRVD